MTNYPNGVASYGLPVLPSLGGGPPPNAHTSLTAIGNGQAVLGPTNVYFVSSVLGLDGNSGKHMKSGGPLATLKQALTLVSSGDTVFLMPGHVENVIAANGIDVAASVLNLQVIGLGTGNQRPTFVFKTSTAATFRIKAGSDGFYMYNCRFQVQIAGHVSCFTVAAKDATFDTVDYYDDGTNDGTVGFLVTGVNCTIKNCFWSSVIANTVVLQWIKVNAGHGLRVINNYGYFQGLATANPANGVVVGVTALSKSVQIMGNTFSVDNGGNASVPISLFAGTTGLAGYNLSNSTGKTAIAGGNALANCMGVNNYATKAVNTNGLLDPVVGS